MITIRNFVEADYDGVKTVLENAQLYDVVWDSKENLLGMIAKDPHTILVALDNKIIVGTIFVIPYGTKVAYLFRVAVVSAYRHRGIASQLITKAEELFRSKGVIEFGLYVDKENTELQEFYKKRGFTTSNKPWIYMYTV